MIRKKKVKIKKIVRKKKTPKVYKYLVNYRFDGDMQKVLVEKEGKNEAMIRMKPIFGTGLIGNRIFKVTDTHILCDTIEEANIKLIEYLYRAIKRHKNEIRDINNRIKEMKRG